MFFPYPWYGLLPTVATILLLSAALLRWAPSAGRYVFIAVAILGSLIGLVWWLWANLKIG
jgi:hypothetical protein